MISNCGHDENGRYSGGAAGDQTGKEWQIIPWYSRPWNVVLRHPNPNVRNVITLLATQAANNNNIGYDQGQRLTFWKELQKCGYYPANIKSKCEADCSSGVAAIIKCAGYLLEEDSLKSLSSDAYTGNLRKKLTAAGFEALTKDKYLTSDRYLLAGDILLYENHHVATNLTNGIETTELVGWHRKDEDWYYYRDGEPIEREWVLSNHYWYRMGIDGKMLKGWHQVYDLDGNLRMCYFEETGKYAGVMWHEAADHQGYMERWYVN